MDLGLKDKVALVAAGSRGLGRAVAEELAAEGASLVLCAREAQTWLKRPQPSPTDWRARARRSCGRHCQSTTSSDSLTPASRDSAASIFSSPTPVDHRREGSIS